MQYFTAEGILIVLTLLIPGFISYSLIIQFGVISKRTEFQEKIIWSIILSTVIDLSFLVIRNGSFEPNEFGKLILSFEGIFYYIVLIGLFGAIGIIDF